MKTSTLFPIFLQLCSLPIAVNAAVACVAFPTAVRPGDTIQVVLSQQYEPNIGVDAALAFGYTYPGYFSQAPLANYLGLAQLGEDLSKGRSGNITVPLKLAENMPKNNKKITMFAALLTVRNAAHQAQLRMFNVTIRTAQHTSDKYVFDSHCVDFH